MSYFRAISFNCMAAILASQLFAVSATAGSITVGTSGQVVVGSKSQHVHNRNNIRIHRHYYSPKVSAPKVYHPKPVPKNAPYVQKKLNLQPPASIAPLVRNDAIDLHQYHC